MDNKIKDNILGKLIIIIWVILFIFSACGIIQASTTQTIEPQANQYFELKATTIKNVNGRKTSNNGALGIQYRFQTD